MRIYAASDRDLRDFTLFNILAAVFFCVGAAMLGFILKDGMEDIVWLSHEVVICAYFFSGGLWSTYFSKRTVDRIKTTHLEPTLSDLTGHYP